MQASGTTNILSPPRDSSAGAAGADAATMLAYGRPGAPVANASQHPVVMAPPSLSPPGTQVAASAHLQAQLQLPPQAAPAPPLQSMHPAGLGMQAVYAPSGWMAVPGAAGAPGASPAQADGPGALPGRANSDGVVGSSSLDAATPSGGGDPSRSAPNVHMMAQLAMLQQQQQQQQPQQPQPQPQPQQPQPQPQPQPQRPLGSAAAAVAARPPTGVMGSPPEGLGSLANPTSAPMPTVYAYHPGFLGYPAAMPQPGPEYGAGAPAAAAAAAAAAMLRGPYGAPAATPYVLGPGAALPPTIEDPAADEGTMYSVPPLNDADNEHALAVVRKRLETLRTMRCCGRVRGAQRRPWWGAAPCMPADSVAARPNAVRARRRAPRQTCLRLLQDQDALPFLLDVHRLDKQAREMYVLIILQQCRQSSQRRGHNFGAAATGSAGSSAFAHLAESREGSLNLIAKQRELYKYCIWPMGTPPCRSSLGSGTAGDSPRPLRRGPVGDAHVPSGEMCHDAFIRLFDITKVRGAPGRRGEIVGRAAVAHAGRGTRCRTPVPPTQGYLDTLQAYIRSHNSVLPRSHGASLATAHH